MHKLEMPKRETCLTFPNMGFIGDELAADEEGDATGQAGAATDAPAGGGTGWTAVDMRGYSGDFATRQAAAEAEGLIKGAKSMPGGIQPILFDCSEALRLARLEALAKAQRQVEELASALNMHVAGATKIAFTVPDPTIQFASLAVFAPMDDSDSVPVGAAATVTFHLTK
ncbi:MAG: hypothetical protein ACXWJC_01675 [Croceibacterium sp.]